MLITCNSFSREASGDKATKPARGQSDCPFGLHMIVCRCPPNLHLVRSQARKVKKIRQQVERTNTYDTATPSSVSFEKKIFVSAILGQSEAQRFPLERIRMCQYTNVWGKMMNSSVVAARVSILEHARISLESLSASCWRKIEGLAPW